MAGKATRKRRVTVSLSPKAVETVRRFRARARMPSLSAALEALIEEWRRQRERRQINAQVRDYYDSRSPAEEREERAWAEFAEEQMEAES